jgi:hypothetical protein
MLRKFAKDFVECVVSRPEVLGATERYSDAYRKWAALLSRHDLMIPMTRDQIKDFLADIAKYQNMEAVPDI